MKLALAVTLAAAAALASPPAASLNVPGQPVAGPGMSPVVTWDPESVYGGAARSPTLRPMSPSSKGASGAGSSAGLPSRVAIQ